MRHVIESGAVELVRGIMARWHEGMSFGGPLFFDPVCFLLVEEATWAFGHLDHGGRPLRFSRQWHHRFPDEIEVFLDTCVSHAAPRELDIAGTAGRIRIGGHHSPEQYTKDESSSFGELVQRRFPGSFLGPSPMAVAVDELAQAIETGSKPASYLRDGGANLGIAVAFHLSSCERRVVDIPVLDDALDVAVDDPWWRS